MSLNQLLSKPYSLCWLFAAIAILMGLGSGEENVDINIYDTYFVISSRFLGTLVAIILGGIGLGYWLMERLQKKLQPVLTGIHLVITIGGFVLIGLISFALSLTETFGELISTDSIIVLEQIIYITLALMLLVQTVYVINLLLSMFRSE